MKAGSYLLVCLRYPAIRTVWFPIIAAIAASTLESALPGSQSFLPELILLLAIVGWWLVGLIKSGSDIFSRRWPLAGARILVLAISIPVLLAIERFAGNYIHLALFYRHYMGEIDQQTDSRPVYFDWGDAAVMVPQGTILRTLVYDKTGGTGHLIGVKRQDSNGLNVYTQHLIGSFYLLTAVDP